MIIFFVSFHWAGLAGSGSDLLLDTLLETGPSLLPGEGLEAAVHAVLHHRNELLVGQEAVPIIVEDLKTKIVMLMLATMIPAMLDRQPYVRTWKTVWTRCGLRDLPVQMVTARLNSSSEMALSASVYIRMAIWKSSKLLRKRQKSRNSSNVMP